MTDQIYVTAAQVYAARLILRRDAARGRESDRAVEAIARAQPAVVVHDRRRAERRAG